MAVWVAYVLKILGHLRGPFYKILSHKHHLPETKHSQSRKKIITTTTKLHRGDKTTMRPPNSETAFTMVDLIGNTGHCQQYNNKHITWLSYNYIVI